MSSNTPVLSLYVLTMLLVCLQWVCLRRKTHKWEQNDSGKQQGWETLTDGVEGAKNGDNEVGGL